ncbi:hypothetical protein OG579_16945 [Williamsia herbipolensis]|uniref:Uncharacterized protein n=1 Tax=Williamsia herbipolensis TaxID=1603258 RepID=A0AAU4JZZ0_9NOCA|nr:hypothetical protein [Williamsia herbipolensis]
MSEIQTYVSERGFELYGSPVATTYGDVVSVYESSAASGPHIWLRTQRPGDADNDEVTQAAHMSVEQATAIRDRLTLAINRAGERWAAS